MPTYVSYTLDDGGSLFVELDESQDGLVQAAKEGENLIIASNSKFRQALQSAKTSAMELLKEFSSLPVDEMEITFGLKSVGEAGFFAVGKIGLEANYQVKLIWKEKSKD